MDVVITKYIGIYGTGILAEYKEDELRERLPEWLVDEAKCFTCRTEKCKIACSDQESNEDAAYNQEEIALLETPEISISLSEGAVYAKEYKEFGVLEALFSMSKELKTGLEINIEDIPVKQETVEVCEALDINPYELYSGGSAVIVIDNGMTLVSVLEEAGIPACVVGHTTNNNDKIVINGDERGFLPHVRKDELKRLLGSKTFYERTVSYE